MVYCNDGLWAPQLYPGAHLRSIDRHAQVVMDRQRYEVVIGMNYWMSVVFRVIPLAMMGVCVGFGIYIWTAGDAAGNFVAGRVVTFLGAICLCLFCTAATIIRQLIGRFNTVDKICYPALGFLTAIGTAVYGIVVFTGADSGQVREYVAGHVVFGIGLISGCVATVATASTKFTLIPQNSQQPENNRQSPTSAFAVVSVLVLSAIPVALAVTAWVFAIINLAQTTTPGRFTVGHVVAGLAMICTSLIGLVFSIVRQIQNTYEPRERIIWSWLVILMGTLGMVWGVVLLAMDSKEYYLTPGFIMIGLGLVCFSILSKVGLLALVWRRTFSLANRVPLLPVLTALSCLFLAAFVFQGAVDNSNIFIAARVLTGLGAVCFSLYSIVSILESGTSSPEQPADTSSSSATT